MGPRYRPRAILLGLALAAIAPALAQGQDATPPGARIETGDGGVGVKVTSPNGDVNALDAKGISATSADGDVKFRIGGKLQYDFGSVAIRDGRFAKPHDGGSDYRRTWIETYLTLFNAVEFAFQYDFADPLRPINDVAVAYRGFAPFIVSVGNFKEPFSLDQLTSDTNTLFTERSLADAFAPARNFGLAIGAHGEAWTAAGGVFGGNPNTGIEDSGVAGTARVTYAPILTKTEVLHLGLAGSYRSLDGAALTLSSKPEDFLFTTALSSTGAIAGATAIGRIGLEAAYQTGPLRFQGEYIWANVARSGGRADPTFHGGYVEAGFTLNGNGRPYSLAPNYGAAYAVFGAPRLDASQRVLNGGIGIVELAARVSYIDLIDRGVAGGREFDYSVGVNWYPETNLKVAASYVRAHATASPAAGRTIDSDIFVGRVQLYW